MTDLLALQRVSFRWPGAAHPVMQIDQFAVQEAERLFVIGPSGCGKTTLLNMLGLLDRPTAGELRFRGRDLTTLGDPAAYRARDIGFIFQSFHLLPNFTVEENVQIPMFGLPGSPAARRARAVELLEAVGLSHRLAHLPVKLSGGERQRAAIARSLANRPSILLADEPTGNLDSKNSEHVMELLQRLRVEHDVTLVMVTHDRQLAAHATRLVEIRDGRIMADGLSP